MSWLISAIMPKQKSDATAQQIMKLLRGSIEHGPKVESLFACADPDELVEMMQEQLSDVLYCTAYPCASLIAQGAMLAWPHFNPKVAEKYSQSFMSCVSYCRVKAKNMSSGAKLTPAVIRIARIVQKISEGPAVGEKLLKGAKKLQ